MLVLLPPRSFPKPLGGALLALLSVLLFAGCDSSGSGACEGDPCACGPCIPPQPATQIDTEPAWSPDGRRIAYTHLPQTEAEAANGPFQIWLLDVGTGQRRFLTPGFLADWSPDGNRLAYVFGGDIHTIEVESDEVKRLTEWGNCFHPSWSPDGEWIAFDTNHNDPRGANVIWTMRADGSEKTDISEHGVGEWREPVWSPNGEWILHIRYVSEEGNPAPELFLMRPKGTEPMRLTRSTRDDHSPVWSPDGGQITWASYGGGDTTTGGLWIMNADGSDPHQITRGGGYPAWSPNGEQIAFAGYNEDSHTITLWTVNADGSEDRPLTAPEDYPTP